MNGDRPYARFGRFNLVGALGAGFQIFVLALLTKGLHMQELAATPMAVEIVVPHNFFWHERLTWRDRTQGGVWQRAIRLWRFHVGNGLISVVGNTVLTYCLVEQLRWLALPAAVAAIAICAPVNFLMADRWVYAAENRARESACHTRAQRKLGGGHEGLTDVGCRTISRFLCPWGAAVIPLGRALLRGSSDLPGSLTERAAPPPLFGLAPRGVYPASGIAPAAVRSYRTISPLP